jgi:uncharacterized protein
VAVSSVDLGSTSSKHRWAQTQTIEGPTAAADRFAALDVLRGVALLGILVLNLDAFSGPESLHDVPIGTAKPAFVGWHATLDVVLLSIKWLFFEGKMRTLFAILYGAGIVLLTDRLERRGSSGRAADIFCRRNMWLLLFGLLHGTLIWSGDILAHYASVALLFLFPLRHVAAKWLIALGLTIGILGGSIGVAQITSAQEVLAAEGLRDDGMAALARGLTPSREQKAALNAEAKSKSEAQAEIDKHVKEGRLPYLQSIAPRTDTFLTTLAAVFRTGYVLEIAGSMLLGMGLFKSGFLIGALPRRIYVLTAIAGYAISLPIVMTGVMMAAADGFSAPAVTRWMALPYQLQVFSGAIANVSVLLLLFKSGWPALPFKAFSNVGRTAFSNYILTSLLCQFLFCWGPWKLYGAIEYCQQIYVLAGMWTVNLLASALWLKHFAYGPLEWVWRSLTYWKCQPILRA